MANFDPEKNIYWQTRLDLHKSRSEACDELGLNMSETRLEKIETGKISLTPNDVILMANAYHCPELCNHYCTHDCDIGINIRRTIASKDIYQIVVETLATLQSLNKEKDNLVEITADGKIEDNELQSFAAICKKLQQISDIASSLSLWVKKMEYEKEIDTTRLNLIISETK